MYVIALALISSLDWCTTRQTSLWTLLVTYGSQTLAPPRSFKTWIRYGVLQLNLFIDCTRDLGRSGDTQQGCGRFLVCGSPFSDKPQYTAMLAIVGGERPTRPTHSTSTDGFWALTQRCWDRGVHLRPRVLQILYGLLVLI